MTNFLRALVRTTLQEVLEAEMTKALWRKKGSGRQAGWATGRVIMAGR
jgi:transposase-like protein